MSKVKVLVFVDWFVPAYKAGGPITSVLALNQNLGEEVDMVVVAGDRDLGDEHPFEKIALDTAVFNSSANVKVYYLSRTIARFSRLYRIIKNEHPDVIYVNGMFSFWFSIFPVLLKRFCIVSAQVIVCPRGMLGHNAVNIKRFKKEFFFLVVRLFNLYKNIVWHATNSEEKVLISSRFSPHNNVCVIPNLPIVSKASSAVKSKVRGELHLIFYSRVLPIKNLHFFLKVVAQVKQENDVVLDVYGPIEDESYWQLCSNLIKNMPPHIRVNYKGAVNTHVCPVNFALYHFMVLPTLHENYGHVIAEALGNGCPVIISQNTPWVNLEEYGAGFSLDISDSESWIRQIEICAELDAEEYSLFRLGAKKYFDAKTDIVTTRNNYVSLFKGQPIDSNR